MTDSGSTLPRCAILDVDGTLVDSNYHHVVAWDRAFREHSVEAPLWRIHRHIGMGGDKLVSSVAGDGAEGRAGDEIRDAASRHFGKLIGEVRPVEGARDLLSHLDRLGVMAVLASSAGAEEIEHYVALLDAEDLVAGWTTSADVDRTKPEPDLVEAAMDKAGTRDCVMVGDTVWDVKSAAKAGIRAVGVLTGGFSREELCAAGATRVYESVEHLRLELGSGASVA